MTTQRYEIEAYLGDTRLTPDQIDTLTRISDTADEAGLAGAIGYMTGDTTLADLGHELAAIRQREQELLSAIKSVVPLAVADGTSQAQAAREAGVDRMTVRDILGLRK